MSAIGLFAVGVLVTLIVVAALAPLIFPAIRDWRYAAAQRLAAEQAGALTSRQRPARARLTKPVIKEHQMQKNIVETAGDAGSFTTLITALDRAGLDATLAGEGPFTVFAPSDATFAALPEGALDGLLAEPDKLAAVLTYHVVPGRVTAAEAAGLKSAPTVQGEELPLSVDGDAGRAAQASRSCRHARGQRTVHSVRADRCGVRQGSQGHARGAGARQGQASRGAALPRPRERSHGSQARQAPLGEDA